MGNLTNLRKTLIKQKQQKNTMQVATLFRESATLLGASSLDPPQTHHQTMQQQNHLQQGQMHLQQQQQQQQLQQQNSDMHLAHHMQHHYKM